MLQVLWVVLALLALPQEKPKSPAEELFGKMEEKLLKAKTVQVKIEAVVKGAFEGKFEGELMAGEGNRVRTRMAGPGERTEILVCDGKRSNYGAKLPDVPGLDRNRERPHLKVLKLLLLSRSGFVSGESAFGVQEYGVIDPRERIAVSGFSLGERKKIGGRDVQGVSYKLTLLEDKKEKQSASVTLWIDAASTLPVERSVKLRAGTEEAVASETYKELKLDGEIDPKWFTVP